MLNTKNLQKSDNFNIKEIVRKSKKSITNKPRRSASQLTLRGLDSINSNISDNYDDNKDNDDELDNLHLYKQKVEILCTRFESIAQCIIKCKQLNHKIKTIWNESLIKDTNNTNINDDNSPITPNTSTDDIISSIINNKTPQKKRLISNSMSSPPNSPRPQNNNTDLSSTYWNYHWLQRCLNKLYQNVDQIGNLIAVHIIFVDLRMDIIDNLYSSKPAISDDDNKKSKKYPLVKNGKIIENASSLSLWSKFRKSFNKIKPNTSSDGFDCIIRKTLGIYLLSLRWILLHSDKYRKFCIEDHKVLKSDIIPMIKFFKNYIANDVIGEIRLSSKIDNILDLMSKKTNHLIESYKSVIKIDEPFINKSFMNNNSPSKNCRETSLSLSYLSSNNSLYGDNAVLSIIDSTNNPYLYGNNGDLFYYKNYNDIISLLPYSIKKEKDLILHILVRRIEKNAQKFVNKQIKLLSSSQSKLLLLSSSSKKNNKNNQKNKENMNSDSDSFVSFKSNE